MKKLYVGNLSFGTTNEDLTQLFSQFGEVASASVVTDRETGRSRGFGFVEMSSGAEEAIAGPYVVLRNLRRFQLSEWAFTHVGEAMTPFHRLRALPPGMPAVACVARGSGRGRG